VACYEKPTGPCSRRQQPGTKNLYAYVLAHSPTLAGNGIYNCRPPAGASSGFSAHAEGRAMDVNAAKPGGGPNPAPIPNGSAADKAILVWLDRFAANWQALGVQRMLYKTREWRCDRGWTKAGTSLALLHANHMHVEQTRGMAKTLTTAQIAAALEGDDDMNADQDARLKRVETGLASLDDFVRKTHHPKEDLVYIEVADETTTGSNVTLGGRLKAVEAAVLRIEGAIAAMGPTREFSGTTTTVTTGPAPTPAPVAAAPAPASDTGTGDAGTLEAAEQQAAVAEAAIKHETT